MSLSLLFTMQVRYYTDVKFGLAFKCMHVPQTCKCNLAICLAISRQITALNRGPRTTQCLLYIPTVCSTNLLNTPSQCYYFPFSPSMILQVQLNPLAPTTKSPWPFIRAFPSIGHFRYWSLPLLITSAKYKLDCVLAWINSSQFKLSSSEILTDLKYGDDNRH